MLAVLLAAVFGAFVVFGDPVRPGAAPPLAEQLADIRSAEDQCGLIATSPRRADAVDTSVVAVLGQDGCTESDRLNVYAYRKGRLKQLHGTIGLGQADPPQRIACLGSEKPDPCHAEIAGGNEMVVIGFRSTATNHLLPAVVWSSDDRLRVASLGLPPPADLRAGEHDDDVRRAQAVDLTPVALPLSGRAVPGCGPPQCLRGYTAAALAILAPAGDSPTATLLAGYVRRGSLAAPERLEVRGFRFIFVGPRPQVGPPCRIERRGKSLPVSAAVKPGQSMSAAMRRAWVRVRATATAATCPFDAALSDGLRARSARG